MTTKQATKTRKVVTKKAAEEVVSKSIESSRIDTIRSNGDAILNSIVKATWGKVDGIEGWVIRVERQALLNSTNGLAIVTNSKGGSSLVILGKTVASDDRNFYLTYTNVSK